MAATATAAAVISGGASLRSDATALSLCSSDSSGGVHGLALALRLHPSPSAAARLRGRISCRTSASSQAAVSSSKSSERNISISFIGLSFMLTSDSATALPCAMWSIVEFGILGLFEMDDPSDFFSREIWCMLICMCAPYYKFPESHGVDYGIH